MLYKYLNFSLECVALRQAQLTIVYDVTTAADDK